jgi:hypothetical protein
MTSTMTWPPWTERVEALRDRSQAAVLLSLTLWARHGDPPAPSPACPVYTLTLWATGENFVGTTADQVLTAAEQAMQASGRGR